MKKEFELPDVGEGVAEGELVSWNVDTDDHVEEDQVIAEVETDKALVEIPSPYDGRVVELRAEAGDTVPVGDVLIVFEVEGEDASSDDTAESDTAEEQEESASGEAAEAAEPSADDEASASDQRVFAPPSVRRLAREKGVDLASLDVTGGRITERDVQMAVQETNTSSTPTVEGSESADSTASTASTGSMDAIEGGDDRRRSTGDSERADRERTLAMPATRRLARENGISLDAVPASERRDGEAFVTPEDVRAYAANDEAESPAGSTAERAPSSDTQSSVTTADEPSPGDRIPYTGVRRTIGEQMAESKYTAPHVSNHVEVEVSDLVETREYLKESAEKHGVKLTYLPFAVKAAVAALKAVPSLNAELDEENEKIILHDEYNIGIAVASDAGLMVPVIENADQKGLLELAREINDKAERTRNRSITLDEMQGGTFTITNIGAIGGEYASPIINYPEAGILALGSLKERPWVADGDVVARPTMPISMSVDHRIVDGAEAAQFTNEVERHLNNPELLLLE